MSSTRFYTDVIVHAVVLALIAFVLVQGNGHRGADEARYIEWKAHEANMIRREERREVFFARWGEALQNAECEAAVIEVIKGEAVR